MFDSFCQGLLAVVEDREDPSREDPLVIPGFCKLEKSLWWMWRIKKKLQSFESLKIYIF